MGVWWAGSDCGRWRVKGGKTEKSQGGGGSCRSVKELQSNSDSDGNLGEWKHPSYVLKQQFSKESQFLPQRDLANVWRHFGLPQLGRVPLVWGARAWNAAACATAWGQPHPGVIQSKTPLLLRPRNPALKGPLAAALRTGVIRKKQGKQLAGYIHRSGESWWDLQWSWWKMVGFEVPFNGRANGGHWGIKDGLFIRKSPRWLQADQQSNLCNLYAKKAHCILQKKLSAQGVGIPQIFV